MDTNNYSIGVDIEDISRFEDTAPKYTKRFLTKIFSKGEIDYCFSKIKPAQHLAARFAAKEAVIKAISALGKNPPALNRINIKNKSKGVPYIELKGYNVIISLSHCSDKAIAVAVVGLDKQ
jgi:holo-[acyl-carrier protein] synthase